MASPSMNAACGMVGPVDGSGSNGGGVEVSAGGEGSGRGTGNGGSGDSGGDIGEPPSSDWEGGSCRLARCQVRSRSMSSRARCCQASKTIVAIGISNMTTAPRRSSTAAAPRRRAVIPIPRSRCDAHATGRLCDAALFRNTWSSCGGMKWAFIRKQQPPTPQRAVPMEIRNKPTPLLRNAPCVRNGCYM